MRELKGKVAVVTGAASGIGRALAERFASEGMKVVLADVEQEPLAEAQEAIASLSGGAEALAVRTDVSDWGQVEALAARTFETFGAAHLVCNNAGIGVAGGFAWELPLSDWEWTLGVNLRGVVHGIRAFVPRLIEQDEGHVVNTASLAGLVPVPSLAPYCASKHAVVAISECLFQDLAMAASRVKVSVVCPGFVQTRIAQSERNRPPSFARGPDQPKTAREALLRGMAEASVARGIPASEVADQVVEAVREDRFWVLTHPKWNPVVQRHMAGILQGRNPEYEVPDV